MKIKTAIKILETKRDLIKDEIKFIDSMISKIEMELKWENLARVKHEGRLV